MEKDSIIYVAGHRGLVGSALVRRLTAKGYTNLIVRTHKELDLTRQADVEAFFEAMRPEYVFLAAAKVGGIGANSTWPAEFIYQNLAIAANVIDASYRVSVKKLVNLGSSCIYPKLAPQPIKEDYLLTGPLEPTNEAYAVAKIAAIKLCKFYNEQYGTNFISAMPTNLYGEGDTYDPFASHVVPRLSQWGRVGGAIGFCAAVVGTTTTTTTAAPTATTTTRTTGTTTTGSGWCAPGRPYSFCQHKNFGSSAFIYHLQALFGGTHKVYERTPPC